MWSSDKGVAATPRIKRFAAVSALTFCLFAGASAQTPTVSAVNLTPDADKVRISAVGDVLDMRVAVSDESGDVVFESGPVAGDHLDWAMSDPQGQRMPAGSYTLTVTYRTSNGKLKRRVEQVLVTEEVKGEGAQASSPPTPQAVATISGQGTTGKLAKFTAANTIGDSVLSESAGRIGLGTAAPAQSLHLLGVSSRLRLQSTGSSALTGTEHAGNNHIWMSGVGGSAVAGVGGKYFVLDQSLNQYRLVIDTAGNFGVGTMTPASKLTVNGGIQILGAGNGIKFSDGSIQTKATAGTITGTGTTNRLVKFTGANSFGNSSITESAGKVGIGTATPASLLTVTGSATTQVVSATNNSTSTTSSAIRGVSNSGFGVRGEYSSGTGGAGVYAFTTVTDGNGIIAEANEGGEAFAIWGKSTNGEAGHFTGRVVVNGDLDILGTLSKDAGSFKIDHPLDPANKYLYHSFVESPDMMNIYNGNVTLNGRGEAAVTMPQWFSALNKEFRYQLTAVGAPGPNLYIAEEVKDNRFRIAGGRPGTKVSWQLTGIRQDAYAEAHRIPVEQDKPARERGSFLHPELHGQSEEKSLERARYPGKMRQAKESESQQPTDKQ